MSDRHLWIFLHVPKTGGTTLQGHLYKHLQWDDEFVHFAKWADVYRRLRLKKPFEQRSEQQRAQARVLSGHSTYYGLHELVPSKEPRYVTFLRDPADRCVSVYHHLRDQRPYRKMSFPDWYTSYYVPRHLDRMTRFLNFRVRKHGHSAGTAALNPLETAKWLLDTCWYVGLTDTLSEDLPDLFTAMGIPATGYAHYRESWRAGTNFPANGSNLRKAIRCSVDQWRQRPPEPPYVLDEPMRQRVYQDNPWDRELYTYAQSLRERRRLALGMSAHAPGKIPVSQTS